VQSIRNVEQNRVIYAYTHPNYEPHKGWIKIGMTTCHTGQTAKDAAYISVKSQNSRSDIEFELIYYKQGLAKDYDVHKLLGSKGYERKTHTENNFKSEWFRITPEQAETAIEQIITKRQYLPINITSTQKSNIKFFKYREEQNDFIKIFCDYCESCKKENRNGKFLLNAKMRFGKTLATYGAIEKLKFHRVLIYTNRPTIGNAAWFKDFYNYIFPKKEYQFSSNVSIDLKNEQWNQEARSLSENELDKTKPFIHFVSIQGLRNKKDGEFREKNKWIFETNWDLVVRDESHEAVDSELGKEVLEGLQYKFRLDLSGTPFKQVVSGEFTNEQIYNWTYSDEQEKKLSWDYSYGENPYEKLPTINLYAYQLSSVLHTELLKNEDESAFDFNEFFRFEKGKFIHIDKIKKFLNNISQSDETTYKRDIEREYPFATEHSRKQLKHTFWLLPMRGGIEICNKFANILKEHSFFKNYEIISTTGSVNNLYKLETDSFLAVRKSIDLVEQKIKPKNDIERKITEKHGTITLSCGQLTTGVTIPEWTGIFHFNDLTSPTAYLQSSFRVQSPWAFKDGNGKECYKTDCYVFDFAPDRTLKIIADFANKLYPDFVDKNRDEREKRIARMLNFLNVLAEDTDGNLKNLDANEVLTIPLKLITQEVVNRKFMSNRLFAQIGNVFGVSHLSEEEKIKAAGILEKLNVEKQGKSIKQKDDISGKVSEFAKKAIIFEKQINKTGLDNAIYESYELGKITDSELIEQALQAKKIDVDDLKQANDIKYNLNTISGIEKYLKDKDGNIPDIEKKIREADLAKLKAEKERDNTTREHLRGFTRTIPSFLMAYGNKNTKLENFEDTIPENIFEDLTSITISEFQFLRKCNFFISEVFNSSIQAFFTKKELLSNYLTKQNEDIFDYIPPQETNQIFTPKKVVIKMVEMLQNDHPKLFTDPKTVFCDLYVKSGLFLTEVAKRLYAGLEKQIPNKDERIKHILENQIYGYAPTEILYKISTNFIGSSKNICQKNTIPFCKNGTLQKELDMKFDVIIGNPPYQENDGGGGQNSSASAIYHKFVNAALDMQPSYISMITKSDWTLEGTKGDRISDFKTRMINENKIEKIVHFPNSKDVFPNTEIDGGVSYFLINKEHNEKNIKFVVVKDGKEYISERPISNDGKDVNINITDIDYAIFNKIVKPNVKYIPTIISTRRPFGFDVLTQAELNAKTGDYKAYSYQGIGYVNKKKITKNFDAVDKYNVYWGKANGGAVANGTMISDPLICGKNEVLSETYLFAGKFDNLQEAKNLQNYIKTKFFRYMIYVGFPKHNFTPNTYRFVPIQDFTSKSDIDWSKPINEINEQLYDKYNLSNNERKWIEEKIKEMG
jgi:hypothetical protein